MIKKKHDFKFLYWFSEIQTENEVSNIQGTNQVFWIQLPVVIFESENSSCFNLGWFYTHQI